MTSGADERLGNERCHEKSPSSSSGRPFGERFGFGYFKDTFDWFTGYEVKMIFDFSYGV